MYTHTHTHTCATYVDNNSVTPKKHFLKCPDTKLAGPYTSAKFSAITVLLYKCLNIRWISGGMKVYEPAHNIILPPHLTGWGMEYSWAGLGFCEQN